MIDQMTPRWEDKTRIGDWIQTYSGIAFYPLDPRPDEIRIADIAAGLSHQCRFTGHTKQFYSVAQHSVEVSYLVPKRMALRGLLHDASEAYLCDIARPLKRLPYMKEYREIEQKLQYAIFKKFGLEDIDPPELHKADMAALGWEALHLMSPLCHPENWKVFTDAGATVYPRHSTILNPEEARQVFLKRFTELF